jgi:hypothetical protein
MHRFIAGLADNTTATTSGTFRDRRRTARRTLTATGAGNASTVPNQAPPLPSPSTPWAADECAALGRAVRLTAVQVGHLLLIVVYLYLI